MRIPNKRDVFILAAGGLGWILYGIAGLQYQTTPWPPGLEIKEPGLTRFRGVLDYEEDQYYGQNDGSWHSKELIGGDGLLARTAILAHAPGNTIFERLYIYNGTIFVISDEREAVPAIRFITSNGAQIEANNDPTEKDIRVVAPIYATQLFSGQPIRLPGTTFMMTEHPQFIAHYYHFAAEIFLSLWRTYATLDPLISIEGRTSLSAPKRLIFPHSTGDQWRDRPGMNAFVVRAAFNSVEMLYQQDWLDLANTGQAFVLDRVVMFDRTSAHAGPHCGDILKVLAEAASLPHVQNWWRPVRNSVVKFVGVPSTETSTRMLPSRRVVTYVDRQGGRGDGRKLRNGDHAHLVAALEALRNELDFELNVVQMERISRDEQIRLASRTNILMGVHGNGLTAMLWMDPSPPAVVFEFFMPGGFIRDYEFTAKSLGLEYHGFWNDTHFTHPGFNSRDAEGFHGPNIPIHGPTVATLVRQILTSP